MVTGAYVFILSSSSSFGGNLFSFLPPPPRIAYQSSNDRKQYLVILKKNTTSSFCLPLPPIRLFFFLSPFLMYLRLMKRQERIAEAANGLASAFFFFSPFFFLSLFFFMVRCDDCDSKRISRRVLSLTAFFFCRSSPPLLSPLPFGTIRDVNDGQKRSQADLARKLLITLRQTLTLSAPSPFLDCAVSPPFHLFSGTLQENNLEKWGEKTEPTLSLSSFPSLIRELLFRLLLCRLNKIEGGGGRGKEYYPGFPQRLVWIFFFFSPSMMASPKMLMVVFFFPFLAMTPPPPSSLLSIRFLHYGREY